ncbi:MAG: hypothetical protein R2865_11595 [Deinococcales bacterium]
MITNDAVFVVFPPLAKDQGPVVLDLGLPDFDSAEVCEAVRKTN